jgi:hypothetical protein
VSGRTPEDGFRHLGRTNMVGSLSDLLANVRYFLGSHSASRGYERQAQSFRIHWRNRNHHAAFSPLVCSGHHPFPPLLKKLFLTTDHSVP